MPSLKAALHFADLILRSKEIDELQLRAAHAHCEQWGVRLPKALADLGFADEHQLMQLIAQAVGQSVTHLGTLAKDRAVLSRLDVTFCEEHQVFPVSFDRKGLHLAMADTTELAVIDEASHRSGARVVPLLASETEIRRAISRLYRGVDLKPESTAHRQAVTTVLPANIPVRGEEFDLESETEVKPPSGFSASRVLGEMLAPAAAAGLTPAERERLEALRLNQNKATLILRAVISLLTEKGHPVKPLE